MRTTGSRLSATAIAVVALAVAAIAIDSDGSEPDRVPAHHGSGSVDWVGRSVNIDDDRWTVAFCEGEAPALCLTDESGKTGGVELSSWPVHTLDVIESVLARGGSHAEALDAFEAEFSTSFAKDRSEGCGPDYVVVPDDPAVVTVAGNPGLRYGFRGVVDGETVEHVVGHAVILGDQLHLIGASGLAEDGCLPRLGEFEIGSFDDTTIDLVGRIAAASRLPTSQQTSA